MSSSKLSRFILPIVWMAIMFWFSSQTNLHATPNATLDFIIKKSAHFCEYFILNTLWFRALRQKVPATAVLISLAWAFSDETHQIFVPGRGPALRDVAIDSLGIAASVIVINRLQLWKKFSFPTRRGKQSK